MDPRFAIGIQLFRHAPGGGHTLGEVDAGKLRTAV